MAVNDTDVTICNQALADIGTRSRITSRNPSDGSTEANTCNLYYNNIRDHALRAVHWNFAKRIAPLQLWKAFPGTPENPNPVSGSTSWTPSMPTIPWVYSYLYPDDCVQARRVFGQPQSVPTVPPIFSGVLQQSPFLIQQRLPSGRFEIGADNFDPAGIPVSVGTTIASVVPVAGGTGYAVGDTIDLSNTLYSIISRVFVTSVSSGAVTAATVLMSGYYISQPTTLTQTATSGVGTGATFTPTYQALAASKTVVLTNQETAIMQYTYRVLQEELWDPSFVQVQVSALAGHICQALTGDKALSRDKISLANSMLEAARLTNGNEDLEINDHIPDWIRARGVGGGLGFEMFFYPIGPLFPVAPLI